jgi:tetratricopeptide (TPR) repeat protein
VSVWQAVEATKARELARAAQGQAVDALNVLTDEVIGRLMAKQARLTEEDRRFLGEILVHFERFAAAKGDHVDGRILRAAGTFKVAKIRMHLGERQAAVEGLGRAIELFGRLATEFPADPSYRRAVAKAHNNLSIVLSELGQAQEAEAEQRQALDLEIKIAAESPQDPECRLDGRQEPSQPGGPAASTRQVGRRGGGAAPCLGHRVRADRERDQPPRAAADAGYGAQQPEQPHERPRPVAGGGGGAAPGHRDLGRAGREVPEGRRPPAGAGAEPQRLEHRAPADGTERRRCRGDARGAADPDRLAADYPSVPEDQHQLATSLNNLAVL